MTDAATSSDASKLVPRISLDRAEGAFLGAAIGDALGWPHEMRATRTGEPQRFDTLRFERWIKRSGGRFQPHEEVIEAGHYSDDTQLILACARSIVRAPTNWWTVFATEELPFWTLYQRGGGGATKRAASNWLAGKMPWTAKPADMERYFNAGGNGVAMRILPHCLRHATDVDFSELATDIMTDGVTTHGHPRALVGALAYGYGLWQAFRHRGTLDYGRLLKAVLTGHAAWGAIPELKGRWAGWNETASRHGSYETLWVKTVREQMDLFGICEDAIAGGAAVIDEEALQALGCFNRSVNGSGTVNAAAAIFLASRHAVEPVRGVTQAALAEGADTDTLASMVGALLGAAIGLEWTRPFTRGLQDERAIRNIADQVRNLEAKNGFSETLHPITKVSLSAFLKSLSELHEPRIIGLPNGLKAKAEPWHGVVSKVRHLAASAWQLTLTDGQTLFVKRFSKTAAEPVNAPQEHLTAQPRAPAKVAPPIHLGFRLIVSDLISSTTFYQEVVGLPITRRTAKSVNLGGILSIGEVAEIPKITDTITVFVEVPDLARSRAAYARLLPNGHLRIDEWEDRTRLLCRDPDGYKVELYQVKRPTTTAE